jgi:tRNA threonylcarbamoyladenosine biosynthesis protein TsaB
LDVIAVVHGPGSFTGVRVGLSAAKGLCEALGVPLVAISRLAVLAATVGAAKGERIWAVLDAGRGEFYCGEYKDGERVREALLTRDELIAAVRGEGLARQSEVGSVVVCEVGVAEALHELKPQLVAEPNAEQALPLAMRRIERGEFDDVATVDANYLRRTDLEIFAKAVKASAAAS